MRLTRIIVLLTIAAFIAGCGGASRAQKRAYQAQESVAKERLKLVEEYQECVKDAGENLQKVEACDSYLKAAEALK